MVDDGGAVALIDEPRLAPDPSGPAPELTEGQVPASPRRPRLRRLARAAAGALALAVVVAVPVAARQAAADARRQADLARAEAGAAAAHRTRVEEQVEGALGPLDESYGAAAEATAARSVQRARLAELQLAEDALEEEVAAAQRSTEAVEAEQRGVGAEVEQQAVDLPQLEGCLAEVRPLVDAAFLATVFPGTVVPGISPTCRSLLAVVEGQGG